MRLIDADKIFESKFHPLPYTHITPTDVDAEAYKRGWNDAIDAIIADAPTIEKPQWIPCSERLPELYVRVLVTDGEDVEMSKLSRMSGEGYIWLFETCWNDCKDWPYWMPLPEPHKEGEEHD